MPNVDSNVGNLLTYTQNKTHEKQAFVGRNATT